MSHVQSVPSTAPLPLSELLSQYTKGLLPDARRTALQDAARALEGQVAQLDTAMVELGERLAELEDLAHTHPVPVAQPQPLSPDVVPASA